MGAITAELVDTGERRDSRGRRVRTRRQRIELIEAYRSSGMTMAEFARQESLNYSTLAGWVAKAGKTPPAKSPIEFAQVQLPAPATAPERPPQLEVCLPDGTVLRGGRVSELASLIRALRS